MNKCYHEVTAVQILKDVDKVDLHLLILSKIEHPEDVISISFVGWKLLPNNDIKASYAVFSYVVIGDIIDHVNDSKIVNVVWSSEKYTFSVEE